MKKRFLILFSLIGFGCFSQAIKVDTLTYTVSDLVHKVLIESNCIPVNNISWKTGTQYGSSNGIGYYENKNPEFPFSKGVILSTGNVMNAPGPNTTDLNDGNNNWIGDSDLEKTLLANGIMMTSKNATVLEFDFVPFSPNFDFNFVFASEEYGNFQCQFSDAFAFLLTNTETGVTTNLAVVPKTTIPISVVTIRESEVNTSCSSENPKYFGSLNSGLKALTSATNFNGQTVLMSASSTSLVPDKVYHIKLVIADRQDSGFDSAIFLGANSFNIGQNVLGPDLTVLENNAICANEKHTLSSELDPAIYSFDWTFNGSKTGGNTPNLQISQPGIYGLTYTIIKSKCVVTNDFITIEFFDSILAPNPVDLYKCDNGSSNYSYNLSYNTSIVSIANSRVSYHATQLDASSNTRPLSSNHSVATISLPLQFWARIEDTISKCSIEKSFFLRRTPAPIANFVDDFRECERYPGSIIADFNLDLKTSTVLGTQSPQIYKVTYFLNENDANAAINPIEATSLLTSADATIFARVQVITDSTCYSLNKFKLVVIIRPVLDKTIDQYVCVSYTLPPLVNPGNYYSGTNRGLPILYAGDVITEDKTIYLYSTSTGTPSCNSENNFKVRIIKPDDIKSGNEVSCDEFIIPTTTFGLRYFTLAGGPTGGGIELMPGKIITDLGTTNVYTYFVSTDIIPCIIESNFTVTITKTPILVDTPNIFECTSSTLPPLSVGNYYTYDHLTATYNIAVMPISTTTKIYIFKTNSKCPSPDAIFTVYISTLGLIDINECKPYNLPPAPIGEYRDAPDGRGNLILPGLISETKTIYTYIANAGCPTDIFTISINEPFLSTPQNLTLCGSYLLPIQPDGGKYYTLVGGPATPKNKELLPNINSIAATSTIYVYKPSTTLAGCYNEKPWTITINIKPIIDSRDKVEQCDFYRLSPLINGTYYDNSNGINPLQAGTAIKESNTIYIYEANPNDPSCFSESSFDIVINGVVADPIPTTLSYCDSFTFPVLPTPNNFYYDAPGGKVGGGNLIPAGTTITRADLKPVYYIFYETGNRLNCSNENIFSVTITNTPVANPANTVVICDTFGANDGIFQFDLTDLSIRNQVLNGQAPDSDFTLTFYSSLADANDRNAIPIRNLSTYQNVKPQQDSVWIRVTNNTTTAACSDVVELKLKVDLLPVSKLLPEYFICEDYKTGLLINPAFLDSGVPPVNHLFEWTFEGIRYGGNTSSISTSQIGNYSLKLTNTITGCYDTFSTRVLKYAPYLEINYSDAFENPTFISVNVLGVGSGNYEYQLDELSFQDSNVFNNVLPGEHIISVRDKNGHCDPAPIKAVIINYPKFFTPNGDSYNENWNIIHLASTNPDATIYIFDRYGKLLKQLSPTSNGWDGRFNGHPLPSDDYWFTVDYDEKGISKVFKSHFSLKR